MGSCRFGVSCALRVRQRRAPASDTALRISSFCLPRWLHESFPGNAGADMQIALRQGDLDPNSFERPKQAKVQHNRYLFAARLTHVHPHQQLKVERTFTKLGEPHIRSRVGLDARTST